MGDGELAEGRVQEPVPRKAEPCRATQDSVLDVR